jgi:hypothetical protein
MPYPPNKDSDHPNAEDPEQESSINLNSILKNAIDPPKSKVAEDPQPSQAHKPSKVKAKALSRK